MNQQTVRLYWDDPYRTRFQAAIVETLEYDGRPAVVLDATCFYPTSGGQPHDIGTLGDARVVEVLEEEGRLLHIVDRPLDGEAVGAVVGEVDWPRRLDHMQQHSGQHILSAAFTSVLKANTVSFHLGPEVTTIDLDIPDLSEGDAERVEDLANAVILEDRRIDARDYSEADAERLPLRKAPAVQGRIRVVSVADFDASACGGTHVASAGQVGLIRVRRWERRRGQTRVEFLCGGRALRDFRARDRIVQQVAADLSVGVPEVPAAVARLAESERAAQHALQAAQRQLIDYRTAELAAEAEPVEGQAWRLLARVLEDCDPAGMRQVAQGLVQEGGLVALLAVLEPAPQVVFARSADVALQMGTLLREVLGAHGGRGGGAPHMAQGGGVAAADVPAILAEARARLVAG